MNPTLVVNTGWAVTGGKLAAGAIAVQLANDSTAIKILKKAQRVTASGFCDPISGK